MIRPGQLRYRLMFQRPVEASDGLGAGGTTTWTNAFTLWAEKWTVKSSERVEAARNQQNAVHRWHLWNHAGIEPSMRISWVNNGTTHYQEIIAINPLGNDGSELEILAEEKS